MYALRIYARKQFTSCRLWFASKNPVSMNSPPTHDPPARMLAASTRPLRQLPRMHGCGTVQQRRTRTREEAVSDFDDIKSLSLQGAMSPYAVKISGIYPIMHCNKDRSEMAKIWSHV